ncbi:MAG: hypothetical protein ABIN80_09785 [Dyadobacter sp.]|uniref:hypothetical protein n=1 Tax=Dyadobacter sp. TaxID=1914288 RepID=UPI003267BB1D
MADKIRYKTKIVVIGAGQAGLSERFYIDSSETLFSALGIINATGTWENFYIPNYLGADLFTGEQLHTRDFKTADYFKGKHVVVVGEGISDSFQNALEKAGKLLE